MRISGLGFQVFVVELARRALNAGFVWNERRSLREHAGVWVVNLENENEDIWGRPCPPALSLFNNWGGLNIEEKGTTYELRNIEHMNILICMFAQRERDHEKLLDFPTEIIEANGS